VTGRDAAPEVVLRRIVVGPLETNCWAVHGSGHPEALLVDPGDEPERVLDAVADLQVTGILLTHAHFDHVLAVRAVAATLAAPVLAHAEDAPVWPHELATLARDGHFDAGTATADLLATGNPPRPTPGRPLWDGRADQYVGDGELLSVGPMRVRAWHTPGHTPGGLSLVLPGGAGRPGHVLTGDTLFPGGPGLTGWPLSDFPTILDSVGRLLGLPVDTVGTPGMARTPPSPPNVPALPAGLPAVGEPLAHSAQRRTASTCSSRSRPVRTSQGSRSVNRPCRGGDRPRRAVRLLSLARHRRAPHTRAVRLRGNS
jgi:hydroxyacylglutathione hydrolase